MIKTIIMVIILAFNQIALANCPEDIQVISVGEKANCDGLLFSPEASKKADDSIQDAKYYKKLSDKLTERQLLQDKQIDILEKRLEINMDLGLDLSKELSRKNTEDKWQKFLYFGLGVLATGIAVYGAAQITR